MGTFHNNRIRILNYIDSQQRFQNSRINTERNNNYDLSILFEELLNELMDGRNENRPQQYQNNTEDEQPQNLQYQDSNEDRQIPKCSICLENNCSIVLIPCGHACVCHSCCSPLTNCPICRREVSSRQTLYL